MFFLSLILLLAVIAAIIAARRGVAGAQGIIVVAVLASVVVLAANLISRTGNPPEKRMFTEEETSGQVLGGLVSTDVAAGPILVLRHPPLARFKQEITASRFAGFSSAIKGKPLQSVIAGPNHGNFGSDDPSMQLFSQDGLDTELQAWLATHGEIKTVVSLLSTIPPLPADRIAYGFVDARDPGWPEGVRSGRIKAVIMYRPRPLPPDTKPEANHGLPPKYNLVTAANLDEALRELQ
jgi:hypothetical protein